MTVCCRCRATALRMSGYLNGRAICRRTSTPSRPMATANHNILPKDYPHEIAEFAAPYRFCAREGESGRQTKTDAGGFSAASARRRVDPRLKWFTVAAKFDASNRTRTISPRLLRVGRQTFDRLKRRSYAYWLPILQDAVYARHVPKELVKRSPPKVGCRPCCTP